METCKALHRAWKKTGKVPTLVSLNNRFLRAPVSTCIKRDEKGNKQRYIVEETIFIKSLALEYV